MEGRKGTKKSESDSLRESKRPGNEGRVRTGFCRTQVSVQSSDRREVGDSDGLERECG